MTTVREAFDLAGRVAIVTGGAGLLGSKHAEAIAECGGYTVLADVDVTRARRKAEALEESFGIPALAVSMDVTDPGTISAALEETLAAFDRVDILINNAARDPKQAASGVEGSWSGLQVPLDVWNEDLAIGLTGAFLCSQIIGSEMVRRGGGAIINVASDLALIGPDQRIYRDPGSSETPLEKPVSYVVLKAGLLGLTRYLATYWGANGVRVNSISPGGVYTDQEDEFVERLTALIPMARMANVDEYKAAIVFLASDASSYMTGANLVVDGGRTAW